MPDRWRDIFPNHISTKRQRQTGLIFPPRSEIDDFFKPRICVSELPLVNDQTGVSAMTFDCLENLIEWHDDIIEFSEEQLKRQEGACHLAWHGNHAVLQRIARIGI